MTHHSSSPASIDVTSDAKPPGHGSITRKPGAENPSRNVPQPRKSLVENLGSATRENPDWRAAGSDWHRFAACRGHDPELWFPRQGDHVGAARAKAICAGCPVRTECLADILGARMPGGQTFGIWGGLCEHERRKVKSTRGRRRKTQPAHADTTTHDLTEGAA